jgi:hypothetical protein
MAQQLNLDRSQRVDIVCRKGDTFTLNLELKDEAGVAIPLLSADGAAFNNEFLMQVRISDDDGATAGDSTVPLQIGYVNSTSTVGLVTFTATALEMKTVLSGLYVYDISQNNGASGTAEVEETILYGTFKVNEDISITA